MILYIGGKAYQVASDNSYFKMSSIIQSVTEGHTRLLTADGYILKDSTGLYLTTKESE